MASDSVDEYASNQIYQTVQTNMHTNGMSQSLRQDEQKAMALLQHAQVNQYSSGQLVCLAVDFERPSSTQK